MTDTHTDDPFAADGEVALPAFEDALWAALRDEHRAAHLPEGADPLVVSVLDGPPPSPRRSRAGLVAAVALVVAGLGAASVWAARPDEPGRTVAGADASSPPGPAATDAPPTEPSSTGPVLIDPSTGDEVPGVVVGEPDPPAPPATEQAQAAAAALRDALARSVELTETTKDGVATRRTWADATSGGLRVLMLRTDGSPKYEAGLAAPPAVDGGLLVDPVARTVDHCFGEWADGVGPTVGASSGGLADRLADGQVVIDGTEEVDGRTLLVARALSLVQPVDPATGQPGEPRWEAGIDPSPVYLDPATLLPVSQVAAVGTALEETTTYTFVPRTDPAALDLLVPGVPEGFTRVEQMRTDDERGAALCW